ncbi:MAG TPA: hypothetical protein VGN97_21985 [Mesorhizobium sp.]|jgi:hypothetical protein|nr:hypothetical protein [Mesorhizobium sp.]
MSSSIPKGHIELREAADRHIVQVLAPASGADAETLRTLKKRADDELHKALRSGELKAAVWRVAEVVLVPTKPWRDTFATAVFCDSEPPGNEADWLEWAGCTLCVDEEEFRRWSQRTALGGNISASGEVAQERSALEPAPDVSTLAKPVSSADLGRIIQLLDGHCKSRGWLPPTKREFVEILREARVKRDSLRDFYVANMPSDWPDRAGPRGPRNARREQEIGNLRHIVMAAL